MECPFENLSISEVLVAKAHNLPFAITLRTLQFGKICVHQVEARIAVIHSPEKIKSLHCIC